ncbi:MAG: hypothetical protein ACYCYM_11980 [Saccharofermentanales bacterium]
MPISFVGEYKKLLYRKVQLEAEMLSLPHGYISRKSINGKTYSYLQSRVSDKLTSRYLKSDEVSTVTKQIALRKKHESEHRRIVVRLEELEQAAHILDRGISRELMLLQASAGMDRIDSAQRENSSSFASAMNAIEGVPISEQAARDISDWKQGTQSFLSIFKATLRRYGFAAEVK